MPRGDGTGPAGMGPMTGRGAGYCAGYGHPGFANPVGGGWTGNWGRIPPYGAVQPGYGYPTVAAQAPWGNPYPPVPRFGGGFGRGRGRGWGRGFGRWRGGIGGPYYW